LFRLSLNIAATRLVLGDADAGRVIAAVGSYMVQGNYVIGLIVFLILVVVQYVVVTNGAQRVAEVAARFTLDSMPGQQMSIDADLNMGLIDQAQAKLRRRHLEKEANFYGSMDGASKFVKGDAIAGIVILVINIVGGLAIGVTQRDMPWAEALQTYTLLTIGDGIVTQIPALVISVGTGIIITRSGSDARLSDEILSQMTAYPKTLGLVAVALVALMLMPGIPMTPALLVAGLVALIAWYARRRVRREQAQAQVGEPSTVAADDVYALLDVEPLEIKVGQNLIPLVNGTNVEVMDRIAAFRKQYALEVGFVAPKVRIRDDHKLEPNAYQICIFGVSVASGSILADRTLAIDPGSARAKLQGVATKDPAYGLPAVWITRDEEAAARRGGFTLVDPTTVVITHLSEIIRQNAAGLLTRAETDRLLARLRPDHAGLLDEVIPQVLTIGEIQKVLQGLLRERVSIRNLEAIIEVLADSGRNQKDTDALTEVVRQRLSVVICQQLANSAGELFVLTLDPAIEHTLAASIRGVDQKTSMVLEPRFAEQVLSRMAVQVERMMKSNVVPVLLCAPELRRHLRRITERVFPHLAVLSMAEVPTTMDLKAFGVVTL
ncbi:MAG: flagellar biosynthesis protein FlhA, partial [Burkholderiales bacterium]|nr:flagellar biosynthesis protein FlhA [Burkholderiales bacterium]